MQCISLITLFGMWLALSAHSTLAQPNDGDLTDLGTRKLGVDWPRFLGPNGDSKSPERGLLTTWPEAGPRVVWQRESGQGYGIGAVANGRYFHFEREDDTARLVSLNAETGEELWRFEYQTQYEDMYGFDGGPRSSPIVDGNRVYIFGVEGMLYCINASTGKQIWQLDTEQEFGVVQNFFGVGGTPVIAGDLLICMIGGSPDESQTVAPGALDRVVGDGSGVVAFDKWTGDVKYQVSDELASYASPMLATIDGRRWCLVFARGGLLGFLVTTGENEIHFPWRAKKLESVNASSPVVVGNQVLITEGYGPGTALLSLTPEGFKVAWQDDLGRRQKAMLAHWNTPVHVDGYFYGCSGESSKNAELRCVEWKSGKVMWSEPGLNRTSLTYVDGHLICLGEYGTLRLVKADSKSFQEVASHKLSLKFPCWAAPVLSHGLLYVRSKDRLVCLEMITE